jgi:hypothetical protein
MQRQKPHPLQAAQECCTGETQLIQVGAHAETRSLRSPGSNTISREFDLTDEQASE